MGPALPTSRQLEGFRNKLGTALPSRSMWMSATVDERALSTVDLPEVALRLELQDEDRRGDLRVRLDAAKTILELRLEEGSNIGSLAEHLAARHRPGTLTIAMLNTVQRATDLRRALAKMTAAEVVLVHSRFRPPERRIQIAAVLAAVDAEGPGSIIVSTQVLEAGVDISAATLFTEAAPWSSLVQRSGRCNRAGEVADAAVLWARPPKPEPYAEADVEASVAELESLEGQVLTPEGFASREVTTTKELHAVLRRRDLIDLFDTTPDLGGNDIDVGRFIRAGNDLDVEVAWRAVGEAGPAEDESLPHSEERCPVPIGDIRKALAKREAWRHDHIDERWVRVDARDVRPGMVLILRAEQGGYEPEEGWAPTSRKPVPIIEEHAEGQPLIDDDIHAGSDPVSFAPRRWLGLQQHLAEVEAQVRAFSSAFAPSGLSRQHLEAVAIAGRLHDIGKVHEAFQDMLRRSAASDAELPRSDDERPPWAKSGGSKRSVRNVRRHFRHELASALALLACDPTRLPDVAERDLLLYLVASHHGRVRLGLRSLPDERPPPGEPDRRVALGIWDGEELPDVEFPGGTLPATKLDLSIMELGDRANGRWSWSRRMLALRDREDLGPFRLAFLESLIRLSDWRASADAERKSGLAERLVLGPGDVTAVHWRAAAAEREGDSHA